MDNLQQTGLDSATETKLQELYNRFQIEYAQFNSLIVGLASGTVVLSVTFLEVLSPELQWTKALIASWILLLISLGSGLFNRYLFIKDIPAQATALYLASRQDSETFAKDQSRHAGCRTILSILLEVTTQVQLWFFALGILSMVVFAIRNVW